jgi:probable F420-dependent oxidoreductase
MRFGISMFATDRTVPPALVAQAAEERGFATFYVPEHTHIPVSRDTPHPLTGDVLDDGYRRTLDPWVALGTVVAVTSRIRLGTSIALVAEHHPIPLAKTLATLDHLSQGRLQLGIGYGWNEEEMLNLGVDPRHRRAIVREHMLAMQGLWTEDEAGFEGTYVRFDPSWSWPKPVQQPLPVLIGGAAGPTLFAHLAEYAHGWMPHGGAGLSRAMPELLGRWEEAGRSGAPEVAIVGVIPEPGKLEYYRDQGVTEIVLGVAGTSADEVATTLDSYLPLLDQFG